MSSPQSKVTGKKRSFSASNQQNDTPPTKKHKKNPLSNIFIPNYYESAEAKNIIHQILQQTHQLSMNDIHSYTEQINTIQNRIDTQITLLTSLNIPYREQQPLRNTKNELYVIKETLNNLQSVNITPFNNND
eukprot:503566_1